MIERLTVKALEYAIRLGQEKEVAAAPAKRAEGQVAADTLTLKELRARAKKAEDELAALKQNMEKKKK